MPKITFKELLIIEELLNVEQTFINKYAKYASICKDPQIKAKCEYLCAKHKNHYNSFIDCME